jgi:CheY-like chemotaxis protein
MRKEDSNGSTGPGRKTFDPLFEQEKRSIELFSLATLISLIIALIMITFDLRLPAGCLVIIACTTGILSIKKALRLIKKTGDSLNEASSSSEKKDDVITDFSHRIREPLNNLVIIGDLLIDSGLQKKQKELIETLIASTNNMVNTVNELTMQSAGSIGYEERKKIRFNLVSTIENTIDLFNLKETSNIDFILNRKVLNQFEVIGDPIILKQILLDVFNNIETRSSGKKVKVNIGLQKLNESGNESLINFRIQTDRSMVLIDDKGLASRLIASGKGYYDQKQGDDLTIIDFVLPFINISPEIKKRIESPELEELRLKEKVKKELKNVNILLVEDNVINQKITLLTLKSIVNNIDTAVNGKEALDKIAGSSYDIILMDIQMPVMDGLVAAEKIRAMEASTSTHIPIIAITANAMLGDKERCISSGMDDYISKPFQPAVLLEKIKKFL